MLNDEDKRSTKRQKRDLFSYVDYVDRSKRKKMAGKAREENKKQKKAGKERRWWIATADGKTGAYLFYLDEVHEKKKEAKK